ncbi:MULTISPECIES: winged helix-turn-helix domain-containing protein [Kocuria]|jgi:DNA-binding winged helix-turn-helix (wHTH) protein|uniref:Transcriptional regulator n=1 Tax=Kocuria rosea subsp. polaris TaxID=136273 RepID=A0A0A6VRS0_KOCRO|nr:MULTISPECIES: winged helix-turn-helix domain-containing protein [Kocuria]KHD97043.1 transcriptional regulator [Kocuria polaris]MCM3485841.1 winged helix-turn-helix domain-containing protein [Kocuria rosea]MEB2527562.1 winged helix-turn-helix domain-containing protein [Kocuria rosea]MEB2619302.1 winged helix-turn-helix domain-containing protein [Kocuria rosea]TQN39593.1 transcriptional regulator [Kocuria rosea]
MPGTPGYVHISQRNRTSEARAVRGPAAAPERGQTAPADYRSLRSTIGPMSAAPGETPLPTRLQRDTAPRPQVQENEARGFVIYVGLDEETAAASGTSLVKMVQSIRAYAQQLVPQADSYAAVALAPANTAGTDLEVVRNALGDPTSGAVRPTAPAAPAPAPETKTSQSTGVLIDLSRREVFLDGGLLNLTFKEFELLNYLVENGSRTVGRHELLHSLWRDSEEVPNERTIDVHIRRLRSKLGRLANTVRTVRGQGYRFYEHPEVVVWAAPEYSI